MKYCSFFDKKNNTCYYAYVYFVSTVSFIYHTNKYTYFFVHFIQIVHTIKVEHPNTRAGHPQSTDQNAVDQRFSQYEDKRKYKIPTLGYKNHF